ncbi:MAG TPA: DNA-formamidopyrimidine glycosylase family protein [Thermoanaerobaculia bacterium]|jgi:endonuclease-8
MPEGNTIHRFARSHTRDFGGRTVRVSSPQGRFAVEARRLDRRRFLRAEAFGKHLFHFWEGGLVVHVHLGMAGWFYRRVGPPPEPKPSVRMRLSTREVTVDLIGPPTCELITVAGMQAVLERLGPDPLRADADPARVWAELRRRRRPIGDALLDQRVISGVGNIYRNEALFLSGIHPLRRSDRLGQGEWRELWTTTSRLMRRGLRPGSIATVDPRERPHAAAAAERKARDDFYVYQERVCRRCGNALREFPLSGRRMWVCRSCQPYRRSRREAGIDLAHPAV